MKLTFSKETNLLSHFSVCHRYKFYYDDFFTEGEKGSVGQKGSTGEKGQKGIPGTCDATVLR